MSIRAKAQCLPPEHNGLVKILHLRKLLIPMEEVSCEIVQNAESKRMSVWANVEGFSIEDNGLIEVLDCSYLHVASGQVTVG